MAIAPAIKAERSFIIIPLRYTNGYMLQDKLAEGNRRVTLFQSLSMTVIIGNQEEITHDGNHVVIALSAGLRQRQQQVTPLGVRPEPIGNL